ncbi:hypothetical protein SeGA_5380 [Salmonella enterica subsp. enterica serovar Gaminara str. A4-567]|nr:hypothetical protein SeGA_5380 [Salmonella enterica subsp. enterica serovar Gaminara str. A4-567]
MEQIDAANKEAARIMTGNSLVAVFPARQGRVFSPYGPLYSVSALVRLNGIA